ncbi:MAG: hypothetical protein ACRD3L_11350 [Terriglobales bacterium]
MTKSFRLFLTILVICLSVAVFAQEDFSAEIVRHDQDQERTPTKIYVTKGKMRVESAGRDGHGGAVILDFATQTSTILMAERNMYMEFPAGRGPGAQRTWNFFRTRDVEDACSDWLKLPSNQGGSCKKIGSDVVNGRTTVKFEGTNSKGETGEVWLDPKIGFPVKWQGKDGGGELQNIQVGTQSPSLFEIPSGYQKMEMPAGMPNRRPQ